MAFFTTILETRWRWLLWILLSFMSVCVLSKTLSPYCSYIGNDNTIYQLVGECWLRGDLPYVDIFDNKGPYLYLFTMIGSSICYGKIGQLILFGLYFAVCIEFLWKIGLLLAKSKLHIILLICVYIFFFFFFVDDTINTEGYSQLFLLIPMYLYIRFMRNDILVEKYLGFVTGMCFGVIALIRINNTHILLAIVICMFVYYCKNKLYKELFRQILLFVGGTVLTTLPMLAYFYANDALSELFYCNFFYNINYAFVWANVVKVYTINAKLIVLFILLLSIIIGLRSLWKNRFCYIFSFVLISFFTFALDYLNGAGYYHYIALVIPCVYVTLLSINWVNQILSSFALCSIPFTKFGFYYGYFFLCGMLGKVQYDHSFIHEFDNLINNSESVFAYNVTLRDNILFSELKITPAMRISYLTEMCVQVDEKIKTEVNEYLESERPKWIMAREWKNPLFTEMIKDYELVYEKSGLMLYKHKSIN